MASSFKKEFSALGRQELLHKNEISVCPEISVVLDSQKVSSPHPRFGTWHVASGLWGIATSTFDTTENAAEKPAFAWSDGWNPLGWRNPSDSMPVWYPGWLQTSLENREKSCTKKWYNNSGFEKMYLEEIAPQRFWYMTLQPYCRVADWSHYKISWRIWRDQFRPPNHSDGNQRPRFQPLETCF